MDKARIKLSHTWIHLKSRVGAQKATIWRISQPKIGHSPTQRHQNRGGGGMATTVFSKACIAPPPPSPTHTHVWGQLAQVAKTVYTEMHTSIREAIQHHRNSCLNTRSHTMPHNSTASCGITSLAQLSSHSLCYTQKRL